MLSLVPLKAACIDLDGVLVDSEPIHYEAERLVLASFGIDFTPSDKTRFVGNTVRRTAYELARHYDVSDRSVFLDMREGHFYRLVQERLELTQGALDFLASLALRDVPMALVTSGTGRYAETALAKFDITDFFAVAVAEEDVTHHKPAPDPYLTAAKGLGVPSEQCLAVEDSPTGVRSATSAGLYCVAVEGPATGGADLSAADEVVDSLSDLNEATLDRLFS